MNESEQEKSEDEAGTFENGDTSVDVTSNKSSVESDSVTNGNGHPIELAMETTATSAATTTPSNNNTSVLNSSHDFSENSETVTAAQENFLNIAEDYEVQANIVINDSEINHYVTTTATTIPPEFSQSEGSSLFASSVLANGSNLLATPNLLAPVSVTPSRKEELLRQAQADRLAWIRKVSLPYRSSASLSTRRRQRSFQHGGDDVTDGDDDDDIETEERLHRLWTQDERLSMLHSSHAMQHLPSVTRILTHLYGLDRQEDKSNIEDGVTVANLAARIQSMLEPLGVSKDDQAVATPSSFSLNIVTGPPTASNASDDLEDAAFLEAYHAFWSKLTTPECTSLVQSMRTFLRNLENSTLNHVNDATTDGATVLVERVATSLRTYIESTLEAVQAHPAWRLQDAMSSEASVLLVRRSLESFLYGHCVNLLDKIMWDAKAQEEDDDWMTRVWSLQFIQARHLELECLCIDVDESNGYDDVEGKKASTTWEYQILQRPIRILQSVDSHFSPFEKLQRILVVYRSVNAALSEALNRKQAQQHPNDSSGPKKLPSADDVLPALILTVLRAKPKRILWNLRMIEAFARPEYLRGEAGYAYTNLYGAIQFLQDIDLTNVEQPSTSLSIPVEEFRQGLEASRKAAEERIQSTLSVEMASSAKPIVNPDRPELSVRAVRQARLRGEAVDLDWATRWQVDQEHISATKKTSETSKVSLESDLSSAALSRSYSFLTTRPEDIRVADLPRLLSEYRTLVHTAERLLVERTSEANAARKKKISQQKTTLLAKAEAVESGMLRKPRGNSANKPSEL